MENLDKTFPDVYSCNEQYKQQAKEGAPTISAGEATQELLETLPETEEDYATAQVKLDTYFSLKTNVDYQIFQFRQAVQQPGETVDQFVTRLRKLALTCKFDNIAKEIKSAVIQNCLSK